MLIPLTQTQKRKAQQILKELVKKHGSQHVLAKALQITPASFSQLLSGKFVPCARVCVLLEAKYGIKKEDIRPDIFMIN